MIGIINAADVLRPCLVGLLFLIALPPESVAQDEAQEVIAYTSLRPANQDIYLIGGPAAKPERLTDHPGLDYNATFSPDGRWLVYTSEREGNTDLYALDLEKGGDPVRLTRSPALDDAADISPDGNRIAFVSTRDGRADIFVMPFAPGNRATEEKAENLTKGPAGAYRPAFSPDGSEIAFSRQTRRTFHPQRSKVTEVMLMGADGSGKTHLAGGDSIIAGSPAWSSDGQTIYYHSTSVDSVFSGSQWATQIKSVDIDGTRSGPITTTPSRLDRSPALGPKGRIYFYGGPRQSNSRPPGWDTGWIYSVNPDGSKLRLEVDSTQISACLTPAIGPEGQLACHGPAPSTNRVGQDSRYPPLLQPEIRHTATLPDRHVNLLGAAGVFPDFLRGGRVAYSHRGFGTPIVTAQMDGSDKQLVYRPKSGIVWATSTCHRDNWIAFANGPPFAPVSAPVDIWKIRADGTGLTNVTADSTSSDAFPAWSSDCEQIVFRSGRDGNKEIYLINADGSNPRRLTHHDSTDTMPALSPDGQHVVYSTTRGGPGYRLRIQDLDGSGGRFLEPERVGEPGRDVHPDFSPDGEWVVFSSSRGGLADEFVLTTEPQPYGDLWAVPVEGSSAVRLTNNKWEDGLARWGTR